MEPIIGFLVMISGAVFGFLSIAILLFALSAHASSIPGMIEPESEPIEGEDFQVFLEELTSIRNFMLLESQGLAKGTTAVEPWSGSYWPIGKGVIAARYSSPTFANSKKFINNYQSYVAHSPEGFVYSGRIKELSPAEKYDLLVGDSSWSLSRHIWQKALEDFQEDGVIPGWTGICHGWAAAAHMIALSPYSPVTVKDVSGRHTIQFHANDIKALVSWIWAESAPNAYRAGNRCRDGRISRDPFMRPVSPNCLDSNPMSWHLAITNRVGAYKKSFAMDSSAGPEVWNYPVTGYDYHYFDPKTFIPTHNMKLALRRVDELQNDRYKGFRSPRAAFIIGIIMDTFHPALTVPTVGVTSRNTVKSKTFIYDLELDSEYNIIGGEWHSKETPDFIWSFPSQDRAMAREDVKVKAQKLTWNINEILAPEIADFARSASRRGEVLAIITDTLLKASATQSPDYEEHGIADEEVINEDGSTSNASSSSDSNSGGTENSSAHTPPSAETPETPSANGESQPLGDLISIRVSHS
jgi:hypothetical protein